VPAVAGVSGKELRSERDGDTLCPLLAPVAAVGLRGLSDRSLL